MNTKAMTQPPKTVDAAAMLALAETFRNAPGLLSIDDRFRAPTMSAVERDMICSALRLAATAPPAGDWNAAIEAAPTNFVNDILSACDPSNWDADRNKGDYYRGLNTAYEAIHEIALEYQTQMYAVSRALTRPTPSAPEPEGGDNPAEFETRVFRAAERANARFGQWMPQRWLEIFISEMNDIDEMVDR